MTAMKSRRLVWGLWGALLLAVGLWWGLTGSGPVLAKAVRPPVEPTVDWESIARRYGIAGESGFQRSLNVDTGYDWHTFYPFGGGWNYSLWSYRTAVDDAGNVYLAGAVSWAWTENGATPLHPYNGANDSVIIKLNSAGVYQWHTFYGGTWNDKATSLVVDTDGNLYVTGYSEKSWNGDGDTAPLHPYSSDSGRTEIFVLKLNSAGVYQWHTFYGGTGDDNVSIIALSGTNDLVAVGISNFMTTTWMGDDNTAPLHSTGGAWALKLTRTGNYLWHTFYGNNAYDVAVAANGDLYVAQEGCDWLGDNDTAPLHPCSGGMDWAVLKLNGDGAYQWHTFYGSAQHDSFGLSDRIALDQNGGVYFTGASRESWSGDDGAAPLHPYENSISLGVLKLNTAGAYQWHTFYGKKQPGGGGTFGSALAVDAEGGVYVGGGYSGFPWQSDNGADPILIGNRVGSVLLKLDSQGRYRWHLFYGGYVPQVVQLKGTALYLAGMNQSSWLGPGGIAPIHPFEQITNCDFSCDGLFVMKLRNLPRTMTGITLTNLYPQPGKVVTVTAWVTGETGMPTGTVTMTLAGFSPVTGTLDAQGAVTYVLPVLGIAHYTVTAEYGGYEGLLGSSASKVMQVGRSSAVELTISPTVAVRGQPVVYRAKVTALDVPTQTLTGTVRFGDSYQTWNDRLDVQLDSNGYAVYTITAGWNGGSSWHWILGPQWITATYLGNEEYHPAVDYGSWDLARATSMVSLTSDPIIPMVGDWVVYTATAGMVESGAYQPGGIVTFTVGNQEPVTRSYGASPLVYTFQVTRVGVLSAKAELAEDYFYIGSQIVLTQTVLKAPSLLTLTMNPLTPTVGDWVDYTATLGTSAPQIQPSGVLTLQVGHQVPMTQVVGSAISYTYRVQAVAGGLQTITATYSGDQNFSESQTHTFQTVLKLATALTVTGPTTVTAGQPAVLTARVQPTATGVVSWSVPGRPAVTGTLDANSVATGTLILPAAGHYSVTVTYGGDERYAPSAAQHELAVWARLYLPLVLKTGQQEMKR